MIQWVDIEQEGASLTMMDRYCLTFGENETARGGTGVPAACMASLRPTLRNATLREEVGEILFVGDSLSRFVVHGWALWPRMCRP